MTPTNPLFIPGTRITSVDSFTTENTFNGGDFGLRWQYAWRNLCFGARTGLAVGNLNQPIPLPDGCSKRA